LKQKLKAKRAFEFEMLFVFCMKNLLCISCRFFLGQNDMILYFSNPIIVLLGPVENKRIFMLFSKLRDILVGMGYLVDQLFFS